MPNSRQSAGELPDPDATVQGPLIALVSGANKGIGLECARRLVEAGFKVYLGARDPELGRTAAATIDAQFVEVDVTSDTSVDAAVTLIGDAEGRLDVLVNNAGVSGPLGDVKDYTAADAEAVLMTNAVGCVRMMHAFLPLLEQSAEPRIVNVSSGLGSFGLFHDPTRFESRFGSPLYGASKAAINMLTARYARLLPHILINGADPGLTATDLSHGEGQSVHDGTDAILDFVQGDAATATGTFRDRAGELPW